MNKARVFMVKFISKHDLIDFIEKSTEFSNIYRNVIHYDKCISILRRAQSLSELTFVCIRISISEELKNNLHSWPREKNPKPVLRFRDKAQITLLILHLEVSTLSRTGLSFSMFCRLNWWIILMILATMKKMI
jgi:hypothetical protein